MPLTRSAALVASSFCRRLPTVPRSVACPSSTDTATSRTSTFGSQASSSLTYCSSVSLVMARTSCSKGPKVVSQGAHRGRDLESAKPPSGRVESPMTQRRDRSTLDPMQAIASDEGPRAVARSERDESIGLLLPAEAGRRNRRTIDGVLLACAAVVLGLAAAIAAAAVKEDQSVQHGLTTLLRWADPFWRVTWLGALGLAAVVAGDILIRRRWLLLRDLVVALAIVGGLGMVLGGVVASDWLPLDAHLLSGWGFPELRLAW